MFAIMYNNNGVGLAAPQIGLSIAMFVMDPMITDGKRVVINPSITHFSNEQISMIEGCLSIPDVSLPVTRPKSIIVKYQDLSGKIIEEELSGYPARIFQHEIDHLNGILFTERV